MLYHVKKLTPRHYSQCPPPPPQLLTPPITHSVCSHHPPPPPLLTVFAHTPPPPLLTVFAHTPPPPHYSQCLLTPPPHYSQCLLSNCISAISSSTLETLSFWGSTNHFVILCRGDKEMRYCRLCGEGRH